MQKVQQEQEELDLDTISAWGTKRTSIPMLKEHLTPPQYVMVQELKRSLSCDSPPPLSQSDWQVRIDRVGIAGRTWDE